MSNNNNTQQVNGQEEHTSTGHTKNDAFVVEKTDSEYQVTPVNSFDALDLKPELLRGIYGKGFSEPSGIQKLGIKPMIEKKDLLAQAQSGSGKTATFLIGAL